MGQSRRLCTGEGMRDAATAHSPQQKNLRPPRGLPAAAEAVPGGVGAREAALATDEIASGRKGCMVRGVMRQIVASGLVAVLAATALLACEGGVSSAPGTPASTLETPAEQVPTATPAPEPLRKRDPFEAPTPGTTTISEGLVASRTEAASGTWRGIVVAYGPCQPEHGGVGVGMGAGASRHAHRANSGV